MQHKRAGMSLKSLPLDLLTDAGGSAQQLARASLLSDGGYVFLIGRIMQHHGIAPKGVVHLGGNTGQESIPYMMMGFDKVLYVEPHPDVFQQLVRNLEQLELLERELGKYLKIEPRTHFHAVCAAASDRDGTGPFHVMASTLFSSTRKPISFDEWRTWMVERSTPQEAEDFTAWAKQSLVTTEQISVAYRRVDTLLERELPEGWSPREFNVLALNIQGAELDAFRGAERTLSQFELIQTELNFVEHYAGNPTVEALEDCLQSAGFQAVTTVRAGPVGTGIYVRKA